MSRDAKRCRWAPSILAVVLACALACQRTAQKPTQEPRPTRLPRFTGSQIMTISGDSIGGKDTSWIEPAVGAYRFDSTELAQGRIVARIWSSKVYPPRGFGPWWSYWWIDKNGVDSAGKPKWRSVFLSDSTRTKVPKSRFPHDDTLQYYRPPPDARHTCLGYTCARLHSGSVVACYDCGGYWCSTKPH